MILDILRPSLRPGSATYNGSVKQLRALTEQELARIEARMRNPAPGSRLAAARDYGIDLSLTLAQLRLTPDERLRKLERTSQQLGSLRGIARKPD